VLELELDVDGGLVLSAAELLDVVDVLVLVLVLAFVEEFVLVCFVCGLCVYFVCMYVCVCVCMVT